MQPLQRIGAPNVRFRERKPSRLQETLSQSQQVREVAERLGDASQVGLIRAALFLSGAAVPEAGDNLKAFLNNLRAARWTPMPVCFSGPQAGDVFVQCDEHGEPVACGFVAKAQPPREGAEPFFLAFDGAEERGRRMLCREVTFWMRGG